MREHEIIKHSEGTSLLVGGGINRIFNNGDLPALRDAIEARIAELEIEEPEFKHTALSGWHHFATDDHEYMRDPDGDWWIKNKDTYQWEIGAHIIRYAPYAQYLQDEGLI